MACHALQSIILPIFCDRAACTALSSLSSMQSCWILHCSKSIAILHSTCTVNGCTWQYFLVPGCTCPLLKIDRDSTLNLHCDWLYLTAPCCTWQYLHVPGCTCLLLKVDRDSSSTCTVPGCTLLYLAVPGCTSLYLAVLLCTWLYFSVLGCTWLYLFTAQSRSRFCTQPALWLNWIGH